MLRQSPSRSYRGKRLRPRHSFQALLLLAVGIWIVYQLTRSYGKRRGAVVVESDDGHVAVDGGEPAARRRLGRKGFAGHDVVGGQGAGWGAASFDASSLSKALEERDGQEEDQEEADEADAADDADDDGLAGDEEDEDDRDLLLPPKDDAEDETETLLGESDRATPFRNGGARLHHQEPRELNGSAVPRAKATAGVQDAAASQQTNATATPLSLSDSPLKNGSSVNLWLHERGTAGDAATAEKLVANGSAVGADNEKHNRMTNRKETTADAVAGQDGILS